jgi:hypothetical protein
VQVTWVTAGVSLKRLKITCLNGAAEEAAGKIEQQVPRRAEALLGMTQIIKGSFGAAASHFDFAQRRDRFRRAPAKKNFKTSSSRR